MPLDPDTRFSAGKSMARGFAASCSPDKRLDTARAFCFQMIAVYWKACCAGKCTWKIHKGPISTGPEDPAASRLANELGKLAAEFEPVKAGYLIGTVYTAMLPADMRSQWGAFYTPPPYVQRLLSIVEQAGFDWSKGKVIDPACGGGAFLAPVALRMLAAHKGGSPEFQLAHIASRLHGVEIDPFAGWMSQVLLEAALLSLCVAANKRMPSVVTIADSLEFAEGQFDLVIGNPPYGRVKLPPELRSKYARSLYGHANLYGLFTDLAVHLAKPNGVIGYVTPTSFLGGQYFKALRKLLVNEAPPKYIDFIHHREGVFDDVLQETLLAVYCKGCTCNEVKVSSLTQNGNGISVEEAGTARLGTEGNPWLLPRYPNQAAFFAKLRKLPFRLSDYGYSVSTGPLVWNRHKQQLRHAKGKGTYPLIWAESVSANRFEFSAERRNHVPYIQIKGNQEHLITRSSCVLVQRTTAKEQDRRLIAAVMPSGFLDLHGAAVVENHLNIVSANGRAKVTPETISALLNSKAADTAFRCISGSVAVSAYELNALPLPNEQDMASLDKLIREGADKALVEVKLAKLYGITK